MIADGETNAVCIVFRGISSYFHRINTATKVSVFLPLLQLIRSLGEIDWIYRRLERKHGEMYFDGKNSIQSIFKSWNKDARLKTRKTTHIDLGSAACVCVMTLRYCFLMSFRLCSVCSTSVFNFIISTTCYKLNVYKFHPESSVD